VLPRESQQAANDGVKPMKLFPHAQHVGDSLRVVADTLKRRFAAAP
jgi:hypothetical protein